jgi:hypothetical protein
MGVVVDEEDVCGEVGEVGTPVDGRREEEVVERVVREVEG